MKVWNFLMMLGFFAAIGNLCFGLAEANYDAVIGWGVALCWFPYKAVFAKKGDDDE